MTTLIPSVEQQKIISAYTTGSTTSVKYVDMHMAIETMMHMLQAKISAENIAIICSDKEKRQQIVEYFNSHGLSNFIYFPQSFSPIDEQSINYIRSLGKDSPKLDIITERSAYKTAFEEAVSRINQTYQGILNPIYKEWNLAEVVYIINSNKLNDKQNVIAIDTASLNPESYIAIKSTIQNAQALYNPMYNIIDASALLCTDIDTNFNISECIDDHLLQLRNLRREFLAKKKEVLDRLAADATTKSHLIRTLGSSIIHKATTLSSINIKQSSGYLSKLFGNKPNSSPWDKYFVEFIENIPTEIKNTIAISATPIESIDDLKRHIKNYENEVYQAYASDVKQQNKTLARISKLNSDDASIMYLDSRFSSIIESLNSSKLYTTSYENNAFSFLKQLEALEHIIKDVSTCYSIVHYYPDYIEWNGVLSSLTTEAKSIINRLYEYPKESWMDIYEQSFLNSLVLQEVYKGVACDYRHTDAAIENLSKLQDTLYDQVIYDRVSARALADQAVKGSKKSLYQTLFKKKLPSTITYVELNQQGKEIVDAYFPIHIYSDVVRSFDDYDTVYNFNEEIGSMEGALNFSRFEEIDFKAINHTTCFPLFLNQYTFTEPIHRLSNYDKIRAAKKLAKFLLFITQDVQIYQLKNANIISTLPSYHSSQLAVLLEERGAKMIETDDLYDNLTECILETGRTQYLLTKDGIVSPKCDPSVLWQQEIIYKYVQAGFMNITIWSHDMYERPNSLDNALKDIIGNRDIEQSQKATSTLDNIEV